MPARTLVTLGRIPYGVAGGVAAGEPLGTLIDDERIAAGVVDDDRGLSGNINGNGDMGGMINDNNGLRGSKEDFEL